MQNSNDRRDITLPNFGAMLWACVGNPLSSSPLAGCMFFARGDEQSYELILNLMTICACFMRKHTFGHLCERKSIVRLRLDYHAFLIHCCCVCKVT